MKIGEAKGLYASQLREYNTQKSALAEMRKKLDEKIKATDNGSVIYADESAILELSYEAISEKQEEYQKYMEQLSEQWETRFSLETAKQQADGAAEYGKEMSRILTVARRIMRGDIVPASDEKKLMEFDSDLYQMAKNAGILANLREKKKHDSLWGEEEQKEYTDPIESANSVEAPAGGPEVVSVEDTMSIAAQSVAPQADV